MVRSRGRHLHRSRSRQWQLEPSASLPFGSIASCRSSCWSGDSAWCGSRSISGGHGGACSGCEPRRSCSIGNVAGAAGRPCHQARRHHASAADRVGTAAGPVRRRLAAAGDRRAHQCPCGADTVGARSHPGARVDARSPRGLSRQRHSVRHRDSALLPPGGLVDVAPDSSRARALLRRPRRGGGRRPCVVCLGPRRARGAARETAGAGDGRRRRRSACPHSSPRRCSDHCPRRRFREVLP